ncbi:MAG: hypothetical protein L0Y71_04065 [Gemmataceae bacterium]|nr:hypothetical protein [Gemmataceae bacterium]
MSKRRLLRWSLVLAIVTGFAVWLEPTRVVWGWLRGDAFYRGRPTSWWAAQVRPWGSDVVPINDGVDGFKFGTSTPPEGFQAVVIILQHQDTPVRAWFKRWVQLHDPAWPEVLDGDPHAESVLRELRDHADGEVRARARLGLLRLHSDQRGPVAILWMKPENVVELELRGAPTRKSRMSP